MALVRSKRILALVTAVILILSSVSISLADGSSANSVIGQVNIKGKSKIELSNVQMIPSNNQQTLAFTITVVNNETTSIDFYDYWIKVKLKNGATIPVKPFSSNADDDIAPQTTQSFTFYSVVNKSTKYSDISVQILQWDFSQPDFTRVLGTVQVPTTYEPAASDQSVTVDNIKLSINFKNVKQSNFDGKVRIEFESIFNNNGLRTITIPSYKYYILTKDSLMYELAVDTAKSNLQAQPKSNANIRLKGEIPEGVELSDAKFIITQFEEQTRVEVPSTSMFIDLTPTVSSDTSLSVATEKEINIDDRNYTIRLDSVQQLPWEDENILSAIVSVSNKTKEALPLPALKAIFSLDGVEMTAEDTKIVKLDGGIGIPVNGKVSYSVYVKIPYTYNFNKVGIELLSTSSDGGDSYEQELLSYSVPKTAFRGNTAVLAGREYKTTTTGKAAGYSIKSLNTYDGNNTMVYDALVEVQNNELRSTTLSEVIGYFKSANGTLYPATITEVKNKINPSARVLLSVSAKIPTNANTNDLRLVLGELDSANQVYYSAAEFRLPLASVVSDLGVLKDKEIYPYNFSINSISVNLTSDAELRFQYTLNKSNDYEFTPDGHTIVVELIDGDVSYTQEYSFEQDLKLGTNWGTLIAQMSIENPNLKLQNIDGFKINVYDQFQGHKKLIASRNIYSIFVR